MHVDLHELDKGFGRAVALSGFNLDVPPATIVSLLGENGAGKSTLLRIMAGISVPDKGMVRYDSRRFTREDMSLRKRLHFTPDMPLMFPDQTVARNIATFAAVYGKTTDGREEHLTRWLAETGAAPLMKRTMAALSRGQAWKVELACVAAIEPELWLVDEPFASGMDAIGMGAFRRLARELTGQGGTVFYTTQMVEMAAEFSDHVCVIRRGQNVMWKPSSEVREFLSKHPDGAEDILRGRIDRP
jgi:ABC-type multidrug transport system ATPase subunit